MPGKRYWMSRPRWPVAPPGFVHFACRDVTAPQEGVASLTVLSGIEKPLAVKTPEGPLVIVNNGFHWVQLAPRAKRWWLTAMFDGEKRLVQFYFDVTFENHILPHGGCWCRDAYLDVILNPDGSTRLLDEDELAAALATGEITRTEYDQACADAKAVMAQFTGHAGELETLCRGYLESLLPII